MIKSELRKLYLQRGPLLNSLCFFTIVLFCFSLALGPEKETLRRGGPVLLWILVLLTTLFSAPLLLKSEAQEGLLDEVLLHPLSPSFYLLSKIVAEGIYLGLPIISLSALLASFFSLSLPEILMLSLTLLIGFPALSALGIFGALLTLHARGGGILMVLLIFPLMLPLLLFALSVMEMGRLGLDSFAPFCLLSGVALLLVIIGIGAGSWALRLAVEG